LHPLVAVGDGELHGGGVELGKSTLLSNMAASDLAAGTGITGVDPHGGFCQDLLTHQTPGFLALSIFGDPPPTVIGAPLPLALRLATDVLLGVEQSHPAKPILLKRSS
jgi:hypothetical protein